MLISTAFTLFLVMNALGIIPSVLTALEPVSPARRSFVLLREMVWVLLLMFLFHLFGKLFFHWLQISDHTLSMSGGVILFLIGIRMIFGSKDNGQAAVEPRPFIVPIAFPIIAGPAVLTAVMFYSEQQPMVEGLFSVTLAWAGTLLIMLFASRLKQWIGDKGLLALQRMMGLLLTLISVHFFLSGVLLWIAQLKS